ncbi:MAG: purine-nucleoside phosphorylase [Coriobacteriaceae bacterium]|jgi:purine-nucleoside phosphorylase|nr:purine-nucleoside phosphorylase [Coriobacteriaceae bacterium]
MNEGQLMRDRIREAEEVLRAGMSGRRPQVAIILGSGLNPLAEELEDAISIRYGEVPHMKQSTALGHVGRFVCGTLGAVEVLCMQGRLHAYEGYTSQELAFPIRLIASLGIGTLIVTNAVGAINEGYEVGDFCIMRDHINFTGRNPVAAPEAAALAERFFSMTDAYDPELRTLAHTVARAQDIRVQEGVYLGLLGPSFETPAEIRMFRAWGADTVAMSAVEEVIAARHRGMRVLGISLVTNMAAGVQGASPNGAEVLETARMKEADFSRLIRGIVAAI